MEPGNFYLIIYLFCTCSDAAGEPSPNLDNFEQINFIIIFEPVYREARFFISF